MGSRLWSQTSHSGHNTRSENRRNQNRTETNPATWESEIWPRHDANTGLSQNSDTDIVLLVLVQFPWNDGIIDRLLVSTAVRIQASIPIPLGTKCGSRRYAYPFLSQKQIIVNCTSSSEPRHHPCTLLPEPHARIWHDVPSLRRRRPRPLLPRDRSISQ